MIIKFLFLFALTLAAFAEKCDQNEADKFYECLKKAIPDFRHGHGEKTKKKEECYTKNNCKPPSQEPTDTQKQCFKSNVDKFKKCFKGKGDHFPEPSKKNDTLFKEWDMESKDFGKGMFAKSVDPKTCPAADAVKACLKDLKPSDGNHTDGNHTDDKSDKEMRKKIFTKICSNVNSCITKLPQQCQKLLNKTKSDVCDCATAQKSDIIKCTENKKLEEALLKNVCNDPCSQGFQDEKRDDDI